MTKIEFDNWLERIESQNPAEPLLDDLRSGFNRVNLMWMRAAVRRLAEKMLEKPEPMEDPAAEETDDEGLPAGEMDGTLKAMLGEKSRAFSELNRASNRFHDCKTDDDRARVSDDILAIWTKILLLKSKIQHYRLHGELPEDSIERFPLPDNPLDLTKKLSSIRARITQTKEKLEALAALETGHPDRSKIADFEEKLKELRLYKAHAENKLKNFN